MIFCLKSPQRVNIANGNGVGKKTSLNDPKDRSVLDLDYVIEQYLMWHWELTKGKFKIDYEDLEFDCNWKRVEFIQDDVCFDDSFKDKLPESQVLFQTEFTNNTDGEQEYTLRAERKTTHACQFSFSKGFKREKEGKFKRPKK